MKTDVAHAAKDDQIVICVVPISANLTLRILKLPFLLLIFIISFIIAEFFTIFFLSLLLHVLEILFFFGVKLIDELKWVLGGYRHE